MYDVYHCPQTARRIRCGGSEPARAEGRELGGQYLLLAFIFSSCLFFVNVEVCAIQKPSN